MEDSIRWTIKVSKGTDISLRSYLAQHGMKGGVRFIDDMEFSFARLADAEKALATLEALLHEYELQLNGNKTKIIELPDGIDSLHATGLRPYIPKNETNVRTQWTDYFNRAFELAKAHPEDGVLRYAVAALQSVKIGSKSWQLAQSLLWQSIALDPGCLRLSLTCFGRIYTLARACHWMNPWLLMHSIPLYRPVRQLVMGVRLFGAYGL